MKKIKNKIVLLILISVGIVGLAAIVKIYGRVELTKNVDCTIDVDFDISDAPQMKDYLLSGIWTFERDNIGTSFYEEQAVFVKLTDDLFYFTTDRLYLEEDGLNNLGNTHVIDRFENRNLVLHPKQNPIFSLNDYSKWSEEFIAMNQDSFVTLVSYNTDDLLRYFITDHNFILRYHKNEMTKVVFDGTYTYKGKTLTIEGEDLYHQEADKHYLIRQKDDHRLYIDGQIISEVPSYHFWIDEEGNIVLFSERTRISSLEDQEILEEYSFYVLKKQE